MTFGDCPDPMVHSFFIPAIVLYSKSPFSLTRDPEFYRIIETLASTLDPVKQEKEGRAMDRYIYREALSLFTFQGIRTYAAAPGLRFEPSVTGMPHFRSYAWDRREARAK